MRILPILFAISLAAGSQISGGASEPARIAEMQAFLLNSRTGALSGNVLAKDGPELGNVPSGEFASNSTLIVVRIQFAEQAPIPKAQVRLVAVESGAMPFAPAHKKTADRIILDRTIALGAVSTDGNTYVGFWLTGIGCRTITLKASIVGIKDAAPRTEVLPIACYE